MCACDSLPLGHDLEGVGQVALHVLHLEGVGVADLVVGAAVVGRLDHDDVTSWAAQLDGVALARQLSAHQAERHRRATQTCRGERREGGGGRVLLY